MRKITLILLLIISSIEFSLAQNNNDLFEFKKKIGKTLIISPTLNECKVYIGYLSFNISEKGKIEQAFFFKSYTDTAIVLPIENNRLKCRRIPLHLSTSISIHIV